MKLGIVIPQHEVGAPEMLRAARLAEEAGLDSVWVVDHLEGRPKPTRPFLECWMSLAGVAASTNRIGVGTLVSRVGIRPPAVTAAMAATISEIAPGRLTVGLGIGDETVKDEHQHYGLPFLSRSKRLQLLEETIDAIRERAPEVPLWLGGMTDPLFALAPHVQAINVWTTVAEAEEIARRWPTVELTWAGSLPQEGGLERLKEAGFRHAIVATGAPNYEVRIEALKQLATQMR